MAKFCLYCITAQLLVSCGPLDVQHLPSKSDAGTDSTVGTETEPHPSGTDGTGSGISSDIDSATLTVPSSERGTMTDQGTSSMNGTHATDESPTDTESPAETGTESGQSTDLDTDTPSEIDFQTRTETDPDLCGNGNIDGTEACDDGNTADRDGCAADCTRWFDADFTRRTRLDVGNFGEELDDFPVLVKLEEGVSIDWDALGNAGLCLVADDHATELAFESNVWNPGAESLVWVRVPAVAAGPAATVLWLYYGNFTNTDGCAPALSVWNDDFAGVWHLDDISDASAHHHRMTDSDETTRDAPGIVGQGWIMDYDDALAGPSNSTLYITGDLTISAWISLTGLDPEDYKNSIVTYGDIPFFPGNYYAYGFYACDNGGLSSYWAYGVPDRVDELINSAPATLDDSGTFYHAAMVRDTEAGVMRYFVDGVQIGDDIPYGELPERGEDGYLMIGGNVGGFDFNLMGVIDELRISSRAVSPHWIALEHASMTDALVTPVMDP